MKHILCFLLILSSVGSVFAEDLIKIKRGSFDADEFNHNFRFLQERIENIIKENEVLKKKIGAIPVGTIVSSMLNPSKFISINGDSWVLAEGQSVINSDYHKISEKTNVPDCRGMFLRGINKNRIDGDPEKIKDSKTGQLRERHAGERQEDAFQDHKHKSEHLIITNKGNGIDGWRPSGSGGEKKHKLHEIIDGYYPNDSKNAPRASLETRPKNIAVYFYIKINK